MRQYLKNFISQTLIKVFFSELNNIQNLNYKIDYPFFFVRILHLQNFNNRLHNYSIKLSKQTCFLHNLHHQLEYDIRGKEKNSCKILTNWKSLKKKPTWQAPNEKWKRLEVLPPHACFFSSQVLNAKLQIHHLNHIILPFLPPYCMITCF